MKNTLIQQKGFKLTFQKVKITKITSQKILMTCL